MSPQAGLETSILVQENAAPDAEGLYSGRSGDVETGAVQKHAAPELHLDNRETVETHTAFLFLTEDRVYKLRKPVDLGFVDLRTRQARLVSCEDEVRLNRRLAPDVYLGVADIRDESGHPRDHMHHPVRTPARCGPCQMTARRLPPRGRRASAS